MAKSLPTRPNLDHLRRQAKTLLAELKDGDASAIRTFIKHLPAAAKMTPAKVRVAGFRLADAQSAIARQSGVDSWAALARHVEELRLLEGEWEFVALQVDGHDMPAAMLSASRLLINGDRFRMESPEANYDGVLTIDAGVEPMRLDIEFVEGPEAGNWSYGIFELAKDRLTICLGLTGAPRPAGFSTKPGSGHALERLRRASTAQPTRVTGGVRAAQPAKSAKVTKSAKSTESSKSTMSARVSAKPDASPAAAGSFDVPMTPLLRRLEGDWSATRLVQNTEEMRADWLPFGSRTTTGHEMKVMFGGQVMAHAKMRIDEGVTPMAVDYLNLAGAHTGKVSLGIMDWIGDEVRFLIASPGQPRPSTFDAPGQGQTLSQWKKK